MFAPPLAHAVVSGLLQQIEGSQAIAKTGRGAVARAGNFTRGAVAQQKPGRPCSAATFAPFAVQRPTWELAISPLRQCLVTGTSLPLSKNAVLEG